jgi:hypothetical protein
MTIQQIRDFIANAKVDRALKALAQLPAVLADEDYESSVTLLSGQYKSNERGRMQGVISNDNYMVERNRINQAILGMLNDLEEDGDALSPVNDVASNPDPIVIDPVQPEIISGDPPSGKRQGDGIIKIVFLASNPSDTAALQLTKEHSKISERLQNAQHPEHFPIKSFPTVTAFEFSQHIFNEKPNIVHFSGHGDKTNPDLNKAINSRMGRPEARTDFDNKTDESGIFLLDDDKKGSHFVTTTFLESTFQMMVKLQKIPIKVVIFNACHSSEQAEVISKTVPYVIGTSWSVGDDAAIAFAKGFYFGIASNMTIENAFFFGRNNAIAAGEPKDRFVLYKDGKKVDF